MSIRAVMRSSGSLSGPNSASAAFTRASARSSSPALLAAFAACFSTAARGPATDSGSSTWSHSSRARSYIFRASWYAARSDRAAVIDQVKALVTSCAADQWWAISSGAVPALTSSGWASSRAANRACSLACWPGSRSSCTTSRSSACRKPYPVSSAVSTDASIASRRPRSRSTAAPPATEASSSCSTRLPATAASSTTCWASSDRFCTRTLSASRKVSGMSMQPRAADRVSSSTKYGMPSLRRNTVSITALLGGRSSSRVSSSATSARSRLGTSTRSVPASRPISARKGRSGWRRVSSSVR